MDLLIALLRGDLRGQKSYDREVAICTIEGKDYGLTMIESGWALAYRGLLPRNGKDHPYVNAEGLAKASSLGIWAFKFVSPAHWRKRRMRLACEH